MNPTIVRAFLSVLIWSMIYLLPYLVAYGKISADTLFKNHGDVVHAISTILLIAYSYLNYYTLVPRFYLHRKYIVYAVLIIVCAMLVIWFPNVFQTGRPDEPMRGPSGGGPPNGRPPGGGGPPTSFLFGISYNVILFIISTFVSISIRQRLQFLEVQQEKLAAELSFLKAQINPHFLFNTLNSIYSLSIQKSDDTPNAIIQLSELMRYILKDSDADFVSLDKELHYIDNYIALQERRLGDTVKITYSSPTGIVNKKVAPLLLMSFIENAFKHGVNPDQDSAISIAISIKEKGLAMTVINNKVSSVNREEVIGIGLKNATSRLEHLYPGKHELRVENGDKTFSVHLTINLE